MTASEYERWTIVRERGFVRYLLTHTVPTYGLMFALVTLGFNAWLSSVWAGWSRELPEVAVKGLLFGGFMGWLQWRNNEKSYALGSPTSEDETPTECLECGTSIPAGEMRCPACGWTYEGTDKTDP